MATCAAVLDGRQYIGCTDGQVRIIASDTFTEGGNAVKRQIISPPLVDEGNDFIIDRLGFLMRVGAVDVGDEAEMTLEISRDGVTWGTAKTKQIGDLGDYDRVVNFRRLGSQRRIEARLTVTDPIPWSVYGVDWTIRRLKK